MRRRNLGLAVWGLLWAGHGFSQRNADSLFRNYLYDSRTNYFRQLPPKEGAWIFWGDSITGWGDWAEFTGNSEAINRGIAGDNTYGLLAREDEVVRHRPEKVFILIGTNDINIHIPLAQSLSNYDSLIRRLKKQSPQTQIYIQSVLPISNDLIGRQYYTGTNQAIMRMNQSLDSLARAQHVAYLDLYPHFLDGSGQMATKYTYDGLHLSGVGYLHWVDLLQSDGCLEHASTNSRLVAATPGEVIALPGLFQNPLPELPYQKKVLAGTRLLVSDDPEYITEPACVVLQESLAPGNQRLYLYNVNGVVSPEKMPRKITAVLRNTGRKTMQVKMLRRSLQPASDNYYLIGKKGLADYFASHLSEPAIALEPGASMPLDKALEERVVRYNELAHGIYEFHIDAPGQLSVLQTAPDTPGTTALAYIGRVAPLGRVNAGRGIFPYSDYLVENDHAIETRDGPVSLTVADGKKDPWLKGLEGSTRTPVELSGNYGVMYHIRLHWKSTDGRALALVTWNPSSGNGPWCGGMANTMVVSAGKFPGGIISLPSARLITGGAPECIFVQLFLPEKSGRDQTIELTYSPPGASCLPTPLIFIPVTMAAQ